MIVLNSPAARAQAVVAMFTFSLLTAACSGGSRDDLDRDRAGSDPASVAERRAVVEKERPAMPPQRAPGEEAVAPSGTGEVPQQLLALFIDDLARRALVKPETITVVSATEQEWRDGALGCPKPGEMYTQAIVPGYRAVLQAGGEKYAYHSDRRGHFIVCGSGLALPPVKQQMKSPKPAE
jgi:hypothetical protein